MAEWSIAPRCKRGDLWSTGVRIPLDAQMKMAGFFPVIFICYEMDEKAAARRTREKRPQAAFLG